MQFDHLNLVHVPIILLNEELKVVFNNKYFKQIFYNETELRLSLANEIIVKKLNNTLNTGISSTLEIPFAPLQTELTIVVEKFQSNLILTIQFLNNVYESLKNKLGLLSTAVNASPDAIVIKNFDGNFILCNETVAKLYGTTPQEMIGKDDGYFTGNQEQNDFFRESVQRIMRENKPEVVYEDSTDVDNGQIRHFKSYKIPVKDQWENPQIVIIAQDITDIVAAKNSAEETAKQLEYVLNTTQEGVWDFDLKNNIVRHNLQWSHILEFPESEVKNSVEEFIGLLHPEDLEYVQNKVNLAIVSGEIYSSEHRMITGTGKTIWVHDRGKVVEWDENGASTRMVGSFSDITPVKEKEFRIQSLANFDTLTGLPNRRYGLELMHTACNNVQYNNVYQGILFIDLDNFKFVNDTLGHGVGDQILIAVANRMQMIFPKNTLMVRLGGDEFLVLLVDIGKDEAIAREEVLKIAELARCKFYEPHHIETELLKTKYLISTSIGVATFKSPEYNINDILRFADMAMYESKHEGKNKVNIFSPQMYEQVKIVATIEQDLVDSLNNNTLEVYYQPIYDQLNRVISAEALLRWVHPEIGVIDPSVLIPIAESSWLIKNIDSFVLDKVCSFIAKHKILFPISVNISAKHILQDEFEFDIGVILQRHNIKPQQIIFEITETVALIDINKAITCLKSLQEQGFRISLDDFGTGYSSLSYLKNLPIDFLKIDKSFTSKVEEDSQDELMVETIIDLGENFNLEIIAEGVETKGQFIKLKQLGCDYFQGYYFNRPLTADKLIDELTATHS